MKWAQALRRYPELEKLGFVALVRAPELAAFEAQISGHTVKSPESQSPLRDGGGFRIVPSGLRSYYCFAAVELARSPVKRTPAGLDDCALMPGLLSSRDSGLSTYTPASAGQSEALAVEAPVYKRERSSVHIHEP